MRTDQAEQRITSAREARAQWVAAADAGSEHAFVQAKWEAYRELTKLAGPGTFEMLEDEARRYPGRLMGPVAS